MKKIIADEFEDLNLIELYPDKPEIIKSSKKDRKGNLLVSE